MPDGLTVLLQSYREAMEKIFGSHLTRIILYGSYARGDFNRASDIDIMILTDVEPEEVSSLADRVYDVTYDFEMQYDVEINPSVQNIQIYNQWKQTYPFFMNIEQEGVAV